MAKQVTVNIFDIRWDKRRGTQSLSDTLDEFMLLKLDQRWREDVRLEHVEVAEILSLRVYKLDFVKRREVGPGRLASNTPIQAIQMARDEDFGEETAALYVPQKKWLLVLNNQAGIGPARMMAYCNALDIGNADRHFDYEAHPKLDNTAIKRMQAMKGITAVSVTATVSALEAAEVRGETALAIATKRVNPKRVSFQLMANDARKKGSFLERVGITKLIEGLLQGGDDVTKLQVSGESPEVGQKDLIIDLLHHKIKRKFSENDLRIVDHRYTLLSRWELLDRSLRGWKQTLTE